MYVYIHVHEVAMETELMCVSLRMCTAATVTEEVTQCTLPPKRVCRLTAERKELTIKVRWREREREEGRERDCLQWVTVGSEVQGQVVTLCL